MEILEIIKQRRSVRTFEPKELSESELEKIKEYAKKVGNPYGIPITWEILDAKKHGLSSPVIVGTDTYIAGKMQRIPNAEEAFGYAFEMIVLYLQGLQIGTTWIAGTMNRNAFEQAMNVSKSEVMPCVSPIGYPAKKMALREALMRKGIKADTRYAFSELFFDGNFDTPLTEGKAGVWRDAFEAVRYAPSAVNKQPWRIVFDGENVHFYEKHNKGFISDGWDIQKIDMGIALCHFELMARASGLDLTFIFSDPEIAVGEDMEYIASYILK